MLQWGWSMGTAPVSDLELGAFKHLTPDPNQSVGFLTQNLLHDNITQIFSY